MSQSDNVTHLRAISMRWKTGKVRDPVCGIYLDPKVAVTKTIARVSYYFCTRECAEDFESKIPPISRRQQTIADRPREDG